METCDCCGHTGTDVWWHGDYGLNLCDDCRNAQPDYEEDQEELKCNRGNGTGSPPTYCCASQSRSASGSL